MGVEDELVSGLCISELETCDEKGPDPRKLQINLTGEHRYRVFMDSSLRFWSNFELFLRIEPVLGLFVGLVQYLEAVSNDPFSDFSEIFLNFLPF